MQRACCSLRRQVFGEQAAALEPAFLARMAEAHSNDPERGRWRQIYKKCVDTKELRLEQVAAHYAISSVFSSFRRRDRALLLSRPPHLLRHLTPPAADGSRSAAPTSPAPSPATHEGFSFAVLHFGDQNITAAVKAYSGRRCAAL